ncbi:S24 family peptidase [Sphingomonas profundi]|uniref:S24 family peptidase n=1 Tax=Alterirhizorhabdus profundi TaxID=2681549 RepID=UPI001E645E94|nr:S24 family peptidase [Sphingomonas profundi]
MGEVMREEDPRAVLEAAIQRSGEDYSSLSRLIGRNAAYIQQFIKRGVPRRLAEEDRRQLSRYLSIPEEKLGGPRQPVATVATAEGSRTRGSDLVLVPRLDIRASAGHGAATDNERPVARLGFHPGWLREVTGGSPAGLSMIRVSGDSMSPTLADGDEILVDGTDAAERLRDGIYVLRVDDGLVVKRLAINPAARSITIVSDNPAYPTWPDRDPAEIELIGRAVWVGRRIA